MKVYFVAAISRADEYGDYYKRIVSILEHQEYDVMSSHVFGQTLADIFSESDEEKVEYYRMFLSRVNRADLVVVEASFPSTVHVGHEISIALEKGKPVILLFKQGRRPVFLEGIKSDKLFIEEYNDNNLEEVVMETIERAAEQQDTRYNFFMSPEMGAYLDKIAKEKKVPRSVYIRQLIEKDMEKEREGD